MKLALINTGTRFYPPLGLGYIASYIKKYGGYDTEIIDFIESQDQLNNAIKESSPDIVGFTAVTSNYQYVTELAEILRCKTDVPFIIGGPHISAMPESMAKVFDVGVIGEGEQTTLELMQTLTTISQIDDIDGIVHRVNDELVFNSPREPIKQLDDIPHPNRDIFDMDYYLKKHDILSNRKLVRGATMLTSRGCPFKCVYCQASSVWGNVRYHSAKYVLDEIKYLIDTYNVEAINIIDDLCIADKTRLKRIVQMIENNGINKQIQFNINGRANLLTEDRVRLIKRMNAVQISIGFESGSEKVLNYLKGGTVTQNQNINALELAKKYKIPVGAQFMIGTPGESMNDLECTLKFIEHYKNWMSHINLNITTPLPGTQLWNYALDQGFVSNDMDFTKLTISPLDDINDNLYIGDIPKDEFIEMYGRFVKAIAKPNRLSPMEIIRNYSIGDIIKTAINNPKKAAEYFSGVIRK